MILEICANGLDSALAAQRAGANRIELCTTLSMGGLTPSYGLIEEVSGLLKIPIMVLIRPRSGNFTYSNADWRVLLADIEICKKLQVAGIVSGALTNQQEIDKDRTKELLAAASGLDFTFHRAFDWTPNPYKALDDLLEIGVPRLLTSGQQATAEKGVPLMVELKQRSRGKMEIMPGGGINSMNALLFKKAGFNEIHCSASERTPLLKKLPKIPMEGRIEEGVITVSSEEKIREILRQLS